MDALTKVDYCKDCTDIMEHRFSSETRIPKGTWRDGPNDRKHFIEFVTPSNKYPLGIGPYYECGRHR